MPQRDCTTTTSSCSFHAHLVETQSVLAANEEEAARADATFSRLADDLKQINQNKHRSALVEPEDLPKREKAVRKVDELFWRSAASGHAKPAAGAQRQRKRTLAKAKASINMPRPSKRWSCAIGIVCQA